MTELKTVHVLILVIVAFMLYHLSGCGNNGFSVDGTRAICNQHHYINSDGYSCKECNSNPSNCMSHSADALYKILNACDGTGNTDTSSCINAPIDCHLDGCFSNYDWVTNNWADSWWELSDDIKKYDKYKECKAIDPKRYHLSLHSTKNLPEYPYDGAQYVKSKSTWPFPDQYYLTCNASSGYIKPDQKTWNEGKGWYCSQTAGNKCIQTVDSYRSDSRLGPKDYPCKFMTEGECEDFKDKFCKGGCDVCEVPNN